MRQSVASVTCETRAKASKRMLSSRVWRSSCSRARLRNCMTRSNSCANDSTARRAACSNSPTLRSRSGSAGIATTFDFVQAVMQRLDQQAPTLRIVDQVVLQVRIALHDPDVAQHFVQHARRAAGAALAAQLVENLPHRLAQQPDDDFAIGERGVVVGNFAQARRRARRQATRSVSIGIERQGQVEQGSARDDGIEGGVRHGRNERL